MRIKVEALEHHADILTDAVDRPAILGEQNAVNANIAFLMHFETIDAADHRRLPRARRTANHDLLTFGHREVYVRQDLEMAKPFVDTAKFHTWLNTHGFLRLWLFDHLAVPLFLRSGSENHLYVKRRLTTNNYKNIRVSSGPFRIFAGDRSQVPSD